MVVWNLIFRALELVDSDLFHWITHRPVDTLVVIVFQSKKPFGIT